MNTLLTCRLAAARAGRSYAMCARRAMATATNTTANETGVSVRDGAGAVVVLGMVGAGGYGLVQWREEMKWTNVATELERAEARRGLAGVISASTGADTSSKDVAKAVDSFLLYARARYVQLSDPTEHRVTRASWNATVPPTGRPPMGPIVPQSMPADNADSKYTVVVSSPEKAEPPRLPTAGPAGLGDRAYLMSATPPGRMQMPFDKFVMLCASYGAACNGDRRALEAIVAQMLNPTAAPRLDRIHFDLFLREVIDTGRLLGPRVHQLWNDHDPKNYTDNASLSTIEALAIHLARHISPSKVRETLPTAAAEVVVEYQRMAAALKQSN